VNFWFISFGEAKEMNSAAGPRPGLPSKQFPHAKRKKHSPNQAKATAKATPVAPPPTQTPTQQPESQPK
jgi:hypothetical protein